ncbi:MAG: patatin-like phospholipase family protein [Thaumarchaeota archaeon]|nr:patatin-like phospholipase family protein [Nitrososphaerota archaeon]
MPEIKKEKNCEENVLVLQGGGSLGAYECGVYRAVQEFGIKLDVVAGTSIGAINATVIAASKSGNPANDLEEFWLNMAEGVTPSYLPEKMREISSSMYAAMWGNPNAFLPLWLKPSFSFSSSPYLYDISPLKKTLEKYVDYTKLKDPSRPRLVITSTDVQNGRSSIFDSKYDTFTSDHVLASAGYPFYGISWTKVGSRYLWDGTLLNNTPLREVIDASPVCDKRVIIANLFPRQQEDLPRTMPEAWHRARDIMHTDKTDQAIRMSKIISRYLLVIKKMHDILENTSLDEANKKKLEEIESEYHKLACQRGTIIKEIIRIERKEESHYLFEDADFSLGTIKKLIRNGHQDARSALENFGKK